MAFCGSCGAALNKETGFCSSCGAPIGDRGAARDPGTTLGGASTQPIAPAGSSSMSSNVAGMLAYLGGIITAIIFLVLEPYKNDRFVRFHAFQSLFFTVACIAFWIIWSIVWGILASISGGYLIFVDLPLRLLVGLAIVGYWLFLLYKAYNNEQYKIPFIGEIAVKQAG